ncbi:DsrE family protein [soil metagenome]
MSQTRALVVKCTAGADEPERANQAFTVAAAAAAAGAQVSLWLTGDAVWFAVPGRASVELPLATPVSDLLDLVVSMGSVTVCSQCAARRSLVGNDLVEGAQIKGAVVFAEEILRDGVQALVY